jgi:hypothetical protein
MTFRFYLLLGVLFVGVSDTEAQMRYPQRPGGQAFMPRAELFRVTGTLKNKMPGILLITTERQQELRIGVNLRTRVAFTGEARPAFLRPGMCVAFQALVDSKGTVTEKVDQLSIFTPSQDKPLGLYPEGGDSKTERPKKNVKKTKEPISCIVRGRLVNFNPHDGHFQVNALRGNVQGELGEDAKIAVEITDASFFSFLAEGDKVAAEVQMLPGMPLRSLALVLKIEASKTLGEAENKEPPNPAELKKRPGRDSEAKTNPKDKGLPAPAEDK